MTRVLAKCHFFLSAICLTGCAAEIVAPKDLSDPVEVYVLDHGQHAILVLPGSDGSLVKYAYGDWRWYALSDERLWQGAAALLWPTQGALGRRSLPSSSSPGRRTSFLAEGSEEILAIAVEHEAVRQLRIRLDEAFTSSSQTKISNSRYDLDFVHDARTYSLLQNSNSRVAEWLEDLGCEVKGIVLLSDWELVQ